MPRGFCFKVHVLATWGDMHYSGLNGIEFFDHSGQGIIKKKLCEFKIAAEPSSVSAYLTL